MKSKVILLNIKDDVATALTDLKAGDKVTASLDGRTVDVVLTQDVPFGHKVALRDMAVGDTVLKYGIDIGKVVKPISAGEHAHVHNIKTKRW